MRLTERQMMEIDAWPAATSPAGKMAEYYMRALLDEVRERRAADTGQWRDMPPTIAEVRGGMHWWWYRQRGQDGYTAPHVLEIALDEDGLFFVEPGCPRVGPEEYGDGAQWLAVAPPAA